MSCLLGAGCPNRRDDLPLAHFGRRLSAIYVETDEPEKRLLAAADRLGQVVRVLRAGDELRLPAER